MEYIHLNDLPDQDKAINILENLNPTFFGETSLFMIEHTFYLDAKDMSNNFKVRPIFLLLNSFYNSKLDIDNYIDQYSYQVIKILKRINLDPRTYFDEFVDILYNPFLMRLLGLIYKHT